MLIDDFQSPNLIAPAGTSWRSITDRVMGGVSEAKVTRECVDGKIAMRLTGDVSLENNGGFVQAALDLASEGGTIDASAFTGVRLRAFGNGERYSVHLRTPDNVRPWQSYRSHVTAGPSWKTIDLPFSGFLPHRLEEPLDIARLRRIGLVAIGRVFHADLAVSEIRFYAGN